MNYVRIILFILKTLYKAANIQSVLSISKKDSKLANK